MKERLIIASYGGSGSTYLAHEINTTGRYLVSHTHACPSPENKGLGVPVFNRYTGGAEGPFSEFCFLPDNVKVIIVVRTPSEAYDSRAGFKHFCHLWSESSYFNEILGGEFERLEDAESIFTGIWKLFLDQRKDIMNLSGWLDAWFNYSKMSNHDIYFLKYEDIGEKENDLENFLNVRLNLSDFEPSKRKVKPLTAEIFCKQDIEYSVKKSKTLSNSSNSTCDRQIYKPNIQNVDFRIKGMKAGAGDAIGRLGKIFSCIKFLFNAKVSIEPYVNYHCKDLDFLESYGVKDILDDIDSVDCKPLSIRAFAFNSLFKKDFFVSERKVTYEIDLTDQSEMKYLDKLIREFNIPKNFLELLTYHPSQCSNNYFSDDSFKVVAHFRRNDILGRIFSPEIEKGPIGKYGLHSRKLVDWDDLDRTISDLNISARNIEVILISDGVSKQTLLASEKEGVKQKIDEILNSLHFGTPSNSNINVVDRIIGNEAPNTLRSLDAMFYADLVVSGSSIFPNIICHIGKTKLIKVE